MTDMTDELDEHDGVIRCFITINYEGYLLTDLFELPIKKEYLLKHIKKKMLISIRIAEQIPSEMRISPKKLLKQLEEMHNA